MKPVLRPVPLNVISMLAGMAALVACSATTSAGDMSGVIPTGTWGGDSGALIVGDTASHLHIGCTFGGIPGQIVASASGGFSANGSYVLRAFPVAVGPSLPAHFVGVREGNTVTISVTVNDTVEHTVVVRGPVVVTLGATPRQMPCPICRDPYGKSRRTRSFASARLPR